MKIIQRPSPNFDDRKAPIRYLIFHATALDTLEETFKALIDSKEPNRVSAHYVIDRDGSIYQLVADDKKAFHAGVSDWAFTNQGKAIKSLNDFSIGVEFQCPAKGDGLGGFTKAQIKSGIELSRSLIKKYGILPQHVLGHSDIAPHRKQDPGIFFPWRTFAKAGIGIWPKERTLKKSTLKRPLADLLMRIGYPVAFGIDENIIAFKRHYMPKAKMTKKPSLRIIRRAGILAEELGVLYSSRGPKA